VRTANEIEKGSEDIKRLGQADLSSQFDSWITRDLNIPFDPPEFWTLESFLGNE